MCSWSPSGTYWQMGQLCFLFISPLQALRQTPLISHAGSHMWLLCPLSVCWHLTTDILFVECESAHCTCTNENSHHGIGTWSNFSTLRLKGCFQSHFSPCWAEYMLLHVWMVVQMRGVCCCLLRFIPPGIFAWLWPCNITVYYLEIMVIIHVFF